MNNLNDFGPDIDVIFKPARPLSESVPPIDELKPGTRVIPADSVNQEGAYPLPIDIEVYDDVAIPMRDGTVLYGDVYRRLGVGPVPVILVYTPYNKRGGYWTENFNVTMTGVKPEVLSGLQPFEAVDPGYWCAHDYAIVLVDARGTGRSEGDMVFMGSASGRDVYDTVEWIAEQPWSTGKTTMTGNSQLAMIQWAAAAERPPHLTAIAPWEGLTDVYTDVINRGGIANPFFHDVDIMGFIYGQGQVEDITGMLTKYPTKNAYWDDKVAKLSQIDIPAYVVASWTHPIHTRNTFTGFEEISSQDKWLRVHNSQEWPDLFEPANVEDLRRFFDHFLKGVDNGWETTPRVRYSVINPGGEDEFRTSDVWPVPGVETTTLYLDAANGALTEQPPTEEASVTYDATDSEAVAKFTLSVGEESRLLGPSNVRLRMSTDAGDDLDVFACVYKVGPDGKVPMHIVFPGKKEMFLELIENGIIPGGPVYVGPTGRVRASHRAIDAEKSTDLKPVLTHQQLDFIEPGQIIDVELGLWPASLMLHPGETLVLEIAGHHAGPVPEAQASDEMPDRQIESANRGNHTIYTGGESGSRLFLPVVGS
ncbi:CocE/NonD family hydrolase [Streptomyces sp. NPDC090106]|uniref:CocE/NonD family hydrolase n=1 Tax=Streptomyces sp. NPDC090106 TaxID=3365946 RepID=UPI00380C21BE